MAAAVVEVLEASPFVAAGNDADASALERGVIKMNDRRHHRIAFMRKIVNVLVHGERSAGLRRLDEQLGVMQLDVGPDEIGDPVCQARVTDQACKGRAVKLHVVTVQELPW